MPHNLFSCFSIVGNNHEMKGVMRNIVKAPETCDELMSEACDMEATIVSCFTSICPWVFIRCYTISHNCENYAVKNIPIGGFVVLWWLKHLKQNLNQSQWYKHWWLIQDFLLEVAWIKTQILSMDDGRAGEDACHSFHPCPSVQRTKEYPLLRST